MIDDFGLISVSLYELAHTPRLLVACPLQKKHKFEIGNVETEGGSRHVQSLYYKHSSGYLARSPRRDPSTFLSCRRQRHWPSSGRLSFGTIGNQSLHFTPLSHFKAYHDCP